MSGVNYVSLMNETVGDLVQLIVTGTVDFSDATLIGFPVDDASIEIFEGKLQVKDSGITIAKLQGTDFWTRFLSDEADIATLLTRTQFQSTSGVQTIFNSHVLPAVNDLYNLGSLTQRWKTIFGTTIDVNELIATRVSTSLIPTTGMTLDLGSVTTNWSSGYITNIYNTQLTTTSITSGGVTISVGKSLVPSTTLLDFGSPSQKWSSLFANNVYAYSGLISGVDIGGTPLLTIEPTVLWYKDTNTFDLGKTTSYIRSTYSSTIYTNTLTSPSGFIAVNTNLNLGVNAFTAGAITATSISSGSITSSGLITSSSLSTGAITSTTINTGTNGITTGDISCGSITSGDINTGTSNITTTSLKASTSVSTPTLTAPGANLSVSKPLQCGTNSITITGVGVLSTPTITHTGASITIDKQINTAAINTGTSGITTTSVTASTSVSTPTLTAPGATLSITKPIDTGTNSITTTGSLSCGTLSLTTLTAATSISTPTLTAPGASLSITKPINTGTNGITTTGSLSCGVITSAAINTGTSGITTGTISCGAMTTGSINTGTSGITTTSITTPTITTNTITSTSSALSVSKDVSLGTNHLDCGVLTGTTLIAKTQVQADRIISNSMSGTGVATIDTTCYVVGSYTTKPSLVVYKGDTTTVPGNVVAMQLDKFGISGYLTMNLIGDRHWELRQGGGLGAGGFSLIDRTSTAERMAFDDVGSVYFNTANTYKRTNVSWAIYSDASIKKDVKPISIGLAEIMALNIREFNFTEDYEHDLPSEEKGQLHYGLIAHEVEKIFPKSVKSTTLACECCRNRKKPSKIKAIDYSAIQIASLRAIQELTEEVQTLKSQIKTLLSV